MALKLTVEKNSGATVEYWRVDEILTNYAKATLSVVLSGYVTEDTRKNGKPPEMAYSIPLNFADFTASKDIRKDAYNVIKKLDKWDESEDC